MRKTVMLIGEPMGLFIAKESGTLEDINEFTTAIAGAEINVSIGLKRLGHDVIYITKLGKDPFGKKVEKLLDSNSIDRNFVSYSDERFTGFMLKSKVNNGDPDIYYYRKNSAASTINVKDLQRINIEKCDYLHITGIFPALNKDTFEATLYLMKRAKELRKTIFFDPNLRPQLWGGQDKMIKGINDLAVYADYILPGISEGKILTNKENKEDISDFYHLLGIKNVIIKLGSKGAYISVKTETGKETHIIEGFKAKVVDTVGAGDGFASGVISAIAEGLDISKAVKRGNAIGAMQVMSIGDNDGLPNRDELSKFMREII